MPTQQKSLNTRQEFFQSLQRQIDITSNELKVVNSVVVQTAQVATVSVGYVGSWNADTNTPTLGNGGAGGVQGNYYDVTVDGKTSIDGQASWFVGDFIQHNGTVWLKVNNQSGTAIVPSDPVLAGTTTVENMVGEVKDYTGGGNTYDLGADGKVNNIVNNTVPSTATLPLNPINGFTQRVINYGTSSIDVTPVAPNQIENLGPGVPLTLDAYLDKVTLLFAGGVWNLI